jgi:uncharacterized protein YjiS (DUF1127 family)
MAYSLFGERPLVAAWPLAPFAAALRWAKRAAKARRRRLALATLMEMDDYRLWDLGISPSDLHLSMRSEAFDLNAIRDCRRGLDVWPPA